MTVKQLFKKNPSYMERKITLVDVDNHWELPLHMHYLFPKPLHKYYKQILKRRVLDVYPHKDGTLTIKI